MAYILAKTSSQGVRHYFTGELTIQEDEDAIGHYVAKTGLLPGDAFRFSRENEAKYWALLLMMRGVSEAQWRVIPVSDVAVGDVA